MPFSPLAETKFSTFQKKHYLCKILQRYMVVKKVIGKMVKIFVNPRLFWQRYEFSSLTAKDLNGKVYPVIMSAFFAIVLFGSALNHMSDDGFPIVLLDTFVVTLLFAMTYFLVGFLENRICRMSGNIEYSKTSLFVLECMLPFYLLYALLSVFPSLFFIWVLVVYSLYIMYYGALYFLKVGEDRVVIFMILSVLIIVFGVAVTQTLEGIIMGFFEN